MYHSAYSMSSAADGFESRLSGYCVAAAGGEQFASIWLVRSKSTVWVRVAPLVLSSVNDMLDQVPQEPRGLPKELGHWLAIMQSVASERA